MIGLTVMELWKNGDEIWGRERDDVSPKNAHGQFRSTHDLRGTAAHYFCCTDDSGISRAAAIRFCNDHFVGKTKRVNVDLSKVYIDRGDKEHRLKFKE